MKYWYINFTITKDCEVVVTKAWKSFEPAYREFIEGDSIVLFRQALDEDEYLQLIMPKKIFTELHQLGGVHVCPHHIEYDPNTIRKYLDGELLPSTISHKGSPPAIMLQNPIDDRETQLKKYTVRDGILYGNKYWLDCLIENIEKCGHKIVDIEQTLNTIHLWTKKNEDIIAYREENGSYSWYIRYHPEFCGEKSWYGWNDKPLPENYRGLMITTEERNRLEEED